MYKTNFKYMHEIGKEIIRCIKQKDKKSINNLFCDKIKDSEYLKNQIDFIFNYIDENGGIVIEDGKWEIPNSRRSYGGGSKTLEYFSCRYGGKVLINKKLYELRFTAYPVFKYHMDYEGVINMGFLEYMTDEMIEKSLNYEGNNTHKRVFLGFDLFNVDYNTLQYMSILPKELNENEEYELLDSIENDR